MKKIIILTILIAAMLFTAQTVYAQQKGLGAALGNLKSATNDTGLSNDLPATVGTVINAALALVGTVFLVLMVYAGILWMTAQGEQEKVEKAQKIIKACIIGLFITMSAYAITFFVTTKLGGNAPGGSTQNAPANPASQTVCCYCASSDCSKTVLNYLENSSEAACSQIQTQLGAGAKSFMASSFSQCVGPI